MVSLDARTATNCSPFNLVGGFMNYIQDNKGCYRFKRPLPPEEIINLAKAILENQTKGRDLTSPSETSDYLRLQLASYEHEVFAVLFLDNRLRVISFDQMFRGTIDGASVYPREVVKAALQHNAAAVIFAHNHPSGVCEPSSADICLTKRLKTALEVVDIRVLDHFVVSTEGSTSFAERGLI